MKTLMKVTFRPKHPGKYVDKFRQELGWTQEDLARKMNVPAHGVHEVINGRRRITTETALRFEQVLIPSAVDWVVLQALWDLAEKSGGSVKLLDHMAQIPGFWEKFD